MGLGKKERRGAKGATGKSEEEEAKRKRWKAEFPGGPSLQHLGRRSGTKPRLQVRVLWAFPQRGRHGEERARWGCPEPLRRRRARGSRLPSPGPPARTSGDCARGARGRAGGPGADHSAGDATKRCPGLRLALALGKEIPVEELLGLARGAAGSRPRRSGAAALSPTDAGGARVSGRKRLSHFLRSPRSSAPSAPDLPSLSPAPFPKPAAHVGARKTRNLNGCSVRHLPPRQVSSRSRTPPCLPALPTVCRAPESSPIGRAHPVPELWPFPLLGRAQI